MGRTQPGGIALTGEAGIRCRVGRGVSIFAGAGGAKQNEDEAQLHRRHGRQPSTIYYGASFGRRRALEAVP